MLSFIPATEMVYQEDVVHEEDYYNFLQPDTEILMKTYKPLPFPPLTIYTFPATLATDFPPPEQNAAGLYEYYLMDAASLLPVMALGIEEGDEFADFCAAPGGKTLAVAFLQKTGMTPMSAHSFGNVFPLTHSSCFSRLLPGSHFCSDNSPSRLQRLKRSLVTYLPEDVLSTITARHIDVLNISNDVAYDKVATRAKVNRSICADLWCRSCVSAGRAKSASF